MEDATLATEAMRERVSLEHLAHNILTDTVEVELAQKVMPELPDAIALWTLQDIQRLLPLLDTEASRITQDTFPDLELSTYDCEQIFRTRIAILQSLLTEKRTTLTPWQFAGLLSGIRQKLNHHCTTLQGTRDVVSHFAGLATASALVQNDIASPPPEHAGWGDTPEWEELRETIRSASEHVQEQLMMGN